LSRCGCHFRATLRLSHAYLLQVGLMLSRIPRFSLSSQGFIPFPPSKVLPPFPTSFSCRPPAGPLIAWSVPQPILFSVQTIIEAFHEALSTTPSPPPLSMSFICWVTGEVGRSQRFSLRNTTLPSILRRRTRPRPHSPTTQLARLQPLPNCTCLHPRHIRRKRNAYPLPPPALESEVCAAFLCFSTFKS
jgi:hypothetical protein